MGMFASSVRISLPNQLGNCAPSIKHFCGHCDPVQLFHEAIESLPGNTDTYIWELSWTQPFNSGQSLVLPYNLRLPDCSKTEIILSCSRCKFTHLLWPPANSYYVNYLIL